MTWDSYVWKTVIFSIQAANSLMKCIPSSLSSFQSTRPRGARPRSARPPGRVRLFQSTRPRGARPLSLPSPHAATDVSIHAPARGATNRGLVWRCGFHVFQSTRPRGARQCPGFVGIECAQVSIHAPARGATSSAGCRARGRRFNPRARAGRDCRHDLGLRGR